MRSDKGFTIVELLVVMVITGVMLLAVGAVSEVGKTGHQLAARESALYNDITYTFKLMQNRIHSSQSVNKDTPGSPWISERLLVGGEAFGIYDEADDRKNFVYLTDASDLSSREMIFSLSDADTLTATFSFTGDVVVINLAIVEGNKISINLISKVTKRI